MKKLSPRRSLALLAFIAFISLGLPDGLLGVAWPSIRANFSLPLDSLGMLLIASTSGYLTSSFISGKSIARLGVGGVLAASCALTGLGLLGYTLAPTWWMMVLLGVVAGLGAGAIDAGLNTYVAANFGEHLMQWLHASYGIGVTLGPIIMTVGLNTYHSWRVGYRVVGSFQLLLAFCFVLTLSMWKQGGVHTASETKEKLTDFKTPLGETLLRPEVWLSLLLFFIYTGAEAALGAWAYTLLTESRGVASEVAGLWAGSYWAMFTVGRLIAGVFARKLGVDHMVRGSLLGALLGCTLLWWNPAEAVSLLGVAMVGFAIAPIFPALVSGTSSRVSPKFAANTIGMQIGAAGLGAALIPGLLGVLARRISLEIIPGSLFALFALLLLLYLASLTLRDRAASRAASPTQGD